MENRAVLGVDQKMKNTLRWTGCWPTVCSRNEIKKMVRTGLVTVDGTVVSDASIHVDPEKSIIVANGKTLNYRKFIYVMMNKPAGVISATYDARLKTVTDLLPDELACFELFPAGRLDIDTEGLIRLTGGLSYLLSPKTWPNGIAMVSAKRKKIRCLFRESSMTDTKPCRRNWSSWIGLLRNRTDPA